MKILQISDTHYLQTITDELDRWGVYYDYREIFEDFLSHYDFNEIDLVIHTGDIVHDGEKKDYLAFLEIMKENIPDHIPVRYVIGNHDKRDVFIETIDSETLLDGYYINIL